jgi:cation diffusion facilitator CzcD-associated flavoprotein CzcO
VNAFIGKRKKEMLDVLIIGGGQAGLALGYHLQQAGQRFQIVERQARVGDNWRNRYDSLTLFTPRAYSALPGLALSDNPHGYPTRDEFAAYLEQHAEQFQLPLRLGINIQRLEQRNGRSCPFWRRESAVLCWWNQPKRRCVSGCALLFCKKLLFKSGG